jgi:hypothetical protein
VIPRPEAAPIIGQVSSEPKEIFEMATPFNINPYDELHPLPATQVPITKVESPSDDSDERHQILARALENRLSFARDLNAIRTTLRTPPTPHSHDD